MSNLFKLDLLFNIVIGQLIAIGITSGGVFTQNIQTNLGLSFPVLQLSFMYLPMMLYLPFWVRDKRKQRSQPGSLIGDGEGEKFLPVYYFLLCSFVDVHATLFMVNSFLFTSITSVMLLQDATIPFVFLLSIFFLKIKYSKTHYFAILLCACGLCCSVSNDLFVKKNQDTGGALPFSRMITGDVMALLDAFLYGLSNILQEHFLKTKRDVNHYLGFLGLFGCAITLIEALFFDEYQVLTNFFATATLAQKWYFIWNIGCFMITNLATYSIIPFFIQRSGATLLNISNVTTVIWGMFSDIIFFDQPFYILYCVAFCFEMTGVIIFSRERPEKKE